MRFAPFARFAVALAILAAPTVAEAAGRLAAAFACRTDRIRLCEGVRPGGGAVFACLRARLDDLSPDCRDALLAKANADTASDRPRPERVLADLAYGPDPKQRLDVHLPDAPHAAPILVMVHGGAWAIGDKAADGVVDGKVAHWLPRGWIFVSVGYRLLPAAAPLEQADDVARALAHVQAHAAEWGGDPNAVVLMGHSAGAHLAALLAADPAIAKRAGARPWAATVALDSAVYDVPAMMTAPHLKLYDRAFGTDPAGWRAASTLDRIAGRPAPLLLVCSTRRDTSCSQARRFASAVESRGGRAEVFPTPQTHLEINRDLGAANPETAAVDAFLASLPR